VKATASGIVAGQQSVIRLVTPVWYVVEASWKSCVLFAEGDGRRAEVSAVRNLIG
jgi:hypothetical protein